MSRSALAFLAVLGVGCARPDGGGASVESTIPESSSLAIVVEPFTAPPPSKPEPIRILVGGDVIPHRPSLEAPHSIAAALAPLTPLFGAADAVVVNYETATGALGRGAIRLAYGVSPEWFAELPASGITAVTVANNHACDLGSGGVDRTLATARGLGVITPGGDLDGDPWQPRTLVEQGGKRVCAVAWTTFVNAEGACARTPRLAVAAENAAGRQKVAAAIERARSSCDATIAIMHGGLEYVPQTPEVMAVAKQAAEAGADAVVIHHPHVASPVVVHATKDGRKIPIFASVGNLVSNQGESWKPPMFPVLAENRRLVCVNGWTRLGVLANLSFDLGDSPALSWGFHLLWTDDDHLEDRSRAANIATRRLDPEADAAIVSRLGDDRLGPTALFRDACWLDRPGADDPERETRCQTTLERAPSPKTPASASAKARAARAARAKDAPKKRR